MKRSKIIMFLLLASVFLSSTAHSVENSRGTILTPQNYVQLEKAILKELRLWCPDAWCSGDYFYSWQSFQYHQIKKEWTLEFVLFPRFARDVNFFQELPNSQTAEKILVGDLPALRTQCKFPSPHPLEMIKRSRQGRDEMDFSGVSLSPKMSELLAKCTLEVENYFRAKIARDRGETTGSNN